MKSPKSTSILLAFFVANVCLMPLAAGAQDVLRLTSVVGFGAQVSVPLFLTDLPGTPINGDSNLQGIALTVSPSPPEAVTGIVIRRAGALANVQPRFEVETGFPQKRTWLISYSAPLSVPTLSRIADLEVTLDAGLPPDSLVTLHLVAAETGLSNADGSVLENQGNGELQLVDGAISLLPSTLIFFDGFESGNTSAWSSGR